jgi:hypothetical protein
MAGGHVQLIRRQGRISFKAQIQTDPQSLLAVAANVRARQCTQRRALLERATRRRLSDELSPGVDFMAEAIDPRIVVCGSRAEHDVFAYAKLSQSVPSAPRAGRRIRLLVMDNGQSQEALIGVVELASPIFSMACRDQTFGWVGSDGARRRIEGLRRVMDLSTCLALPPYAALRAGKLLALLAASDVVSDIFHSRYGERLAAIVATCATGLHYPQLNRLNVRRGGLYRRVGATAGYSTCMFSSETLAAARALVNEGAPAASFGPNHVKGIRLLRTALRQCGLNEEMLLRTDHPKGVYVCDVTSDGVESLGCGAEPKGRATRADHGSRWWHEKVLAPLLHGPGGPSKPQVA